MRSPLLPGTVTASSGELEGVQSRKDRVEWLAGEAEEARVRRPEVLTAEEAAALLQVARKFIYAHARELGGYRLLGDRGPWRFSRLDLLERREPPVRRRGAQRTRAGRPSTAGPARTPCGAPILPAEPRRRAS